MSGVQDRAWHCSAGAPCPLDARVLLLVNDLVQADGAGLLHALKDHLEVDGELNLELLAGLDHPEPAQDGAFLRQGVVAGVRGGMWGNAARRGAVRRAGWLSRHAPLSSEDPRPQRRPSTSVSVKGSVSQPSLLVAG